MKRTRYFLIVLFSFLGLTSFSQGEFIVEIDRTTGSYIKTGPLINGINTVYYDFRALNENDGVFMFASSTPSKRLFSIDVSNDAIISNPLYDNLVEFEYSNSANLLYGLLKDDANNVKYLASINTSTAVATTIGDPISGSSTFQGKSAINQSGNTYTFICPPNLLYSINTNNGNIFSNPALQLSSNETIVNICYSNSSGILYGLLIDNTIQKHFLISINISTGVITRIGSGGSIFGANGSSTIDEQNQQYICLYSSSTMGGYGVATIDIATGNILHNNLVTTFSTSDNFINVEYDNIQSKLYSMHWDNLIEPLGINSITQYSDIKFFPNPFTTQTVLQTDRHLQDATLTLYNSLGQQVRQVSNISGLTATLHRDNLPSGLYYLQLTQDNQTIATDKLVITDK
ncbi:MAG: hypothetical protein POELPBGB_01064 [Bacteroidia bacterium]|nr:hypothetical protein [Bacteroidia bacterium]